MVDKTYTAPVPRVIARTNPKGQDIQVTDDRMYRNDSFVLHFQHGSIPMYGVRNGCFEEELLLVLIDRAKLAGDAKFEAALTAALEVIVAEDTAAETQPTTPAKPPAVAEAATESP